MMEAVEFLRLIVTKLQDLQLSYAEDQEDWFQIGIDTARCLSAIVAGEMADRLRAELLQRGARKTIAIPLLQNVDGKEWRSQHVERFGGICARLCVGELARLDIRYAR